jgi:hypothetical protein
MDLELLHLPHDIPVIPLHRMGYAPSANGATSLQDSILPPCERDACTFRGKLVPPLTRASIGLHEAARIARVKADTSGGSEFGFLFRLTIHAMIARPSPRVAQRLAEAEGVEIWDALRPYAEAGTFHGVQLPSGLVVFDAAQDGISLHEEFVWRIKSSGSNVG